MKAQDRAMATVKENRELIEKLEKELESLSSSFLEIKEIDEKLERRDKNLKRFTAIIALLLVLSSAVLILTSCDMFPLFNQIEEETESRETLEGTRWHSIEGEESIRVRDGYVTRIVFKKGGVLSLEVDDDPAQHANASYDEEKKIITIAEREYSYSVSMAADYYITLIANDGSKYTFLRD